MSLIPANILYLNVSTVHILDIAAPKVDGIWIELQPLCNMKRVHMPTTSVMGCHAAHLEDIDLMAFSRTGR